MTRPIRVIVAKVGLDGHDRGARIIARAFRDAGMEVIYTGLRRTPEELAQIALQEDADALGLSILSGSVVPLTQRVIDALRTQGMEDVLVVVGGIISPEVSRALADVGVEGAFGPGSSLTDIILFTRREVDRRRSLQTD